MLRHSPGAGSSANHGTHALDPTLRASSASQQATPGSPMMHQQTRSGRISRPPLQQPAQSVFDLGMLLRASESASSPFSGMTNREMANIVASAARLAQAQQANAIQGAPHTPILPSIAMSGGQAATSRASQNDQAALTEMMTRSTRATAQRQTPGASSSSRADSSQQVAPTRTHRAEKRQSDHGHPYATPSPESGSDDSGGSDTETGYRDQQSGRKRRSRFEDDQDGDTRPARRPRRKYYKTKEESMEARKIRNRQTATKARERRQAEMLDMADKIKAMEEELAEMRQKHDKLAKEHHQLQRTHARCASAKDFANALDDATQPRVPVRATADADSFNLPASTPDNEETDPWLLFQALLAQHGGLPTGNEEDDEDDAEFMPSSPRHERDEDDVSDNEQTPHDEGAVGSALAVAASADDYTLMPADPSASYADGADDFYDPDDYFNDPDMEDEDLFQPIEDVAIPDGELEAIQAMYERNLPSSHYMPQYDPEMVLGAILSAKGALSTKNQS